MNLYPHRIILNLLSVLVALFIFCSCDREIANITGKCDKEKKKSNQCLLSTVIACENSPDAERYRRLGISICTNPDGYVFLISALCDVPEECKPAPKTSSSRRD